MSKIASIAVISSFSSAAAMNSVVVGSASADSAVLVGGSSFFAGMDVVAKACRQTERDLKEANDNSKRMVPKPNEKKNYPRAEDHER